jgi:hypothetical protein
MADPDIQQLKQELESERDRADRAEIEAIIAWGALATFRELVVQQCGINVAMLNGYESIKALEGAKLQDEVDRRFKKRREREETERAKRLQGFLDTLPPGEMDMEPEDDEWNPPGPIHDDGPGDEPVSEEEI